MLFAAVRCCLVLCAVACSLMSVVGVLLCCCVQLFGGECCCA